MERVARILEDDPLPRVAAVLSACRGVTDALLTLVKAAEHREDGDAGRLEAIRQRHIGIARSLLAEPAADAYIEELTSNCRDIAGILQTVGLIRVASPVVRDLVAGFGEIWSARLFSRYLQARGRRPGDVRWIDADRIIPRDPSVTLIITGFIARTREGLQATLGRNGSDFSASIFGALLDAAEIVIWTDADGVLSADPRRVPDATIIDTLSYNEAMELAYFGAKVLHPQTMAPAVSRGIPIWIRNTFAPEKAGTLICAEPVSSHPVKGITSIDRVALINVEGTGMIGVPGTAQRLFGARL